MVILIGGDSHSGKTIMAQKLLEKYHITYLSIDHIKMGLIRGTDDCRFNVEDKDDFITEKIWPIIKGIIMTNIENNQNIIIEGCYIPPSKIEDFDATYRQKIIPVFLGFSKKYIIDNFSNQILANANVIENRICDYSSTQQLIMGNTYFKNQCKQHNQMYFEIANDYNSEIKKAYDWIDVQINNQNNLPI